MDEFQPTEFDCLSCGRVITRDLRAGAAIPKCHVCGGSLKPKNEEENAMTPKKDWSVAVVTRGANTISSQIRDARFCEVAARLIDWIDNPSYQGDEPIFVAVYCSDEGAPRCFPEADFGTLRALASGADREATA